jgi:uncharacterized repeat protein (TIGR01451 family)
MKNILLLLLFISGVGFAQPIINNPSPLEVCDNNGNGIANFNLDTQSQFILNGLSLSTHAISYHLTNTDANVGANQINLIYNYVNVYSYSQVIWVRVTEISTSLFSITQLNLIVNPKPSNTVKNLVLNDDGIFDGFRSFDLNAELPFILYVDGILQPNCFSTFHSTLFDAETNSSLLASNFTNVTNPQTIFCRVTNNMTGCNTIKSIELLVNNPLNVYIPDANLKNALLTTTCADFNNDNILDGDADTNNDGEVQITEGLNVKQLIFAPTNATGFEVSSILGIEAFTNLKKLNFGFINFTTFNSVNFSTLTQLEFLEFNRSETNVLTTIDLSNMTNLKTLNLQSHRKFISPNTFIIANLNLSGCTALENFNYYNSSFNIDFCQIPNLKNLDCSYLEGGEPPVFDFSCLSQLETLNISENTIDTLILKNGSLLNTLNMSNLNSFPKYICTDINPLEITQIQNQLLPGYTTVINSYCSFNPGGLYNTISGKVKFDSLYDGCDNNDPVIKNLKMSISGWGGTDYTFANNIGEYKYFTTFADQLVTPIFENPDYFNVSPTSSLVSFPSTSNLTEVRDFCVTANGFHQDAEIVLVALDQPRPGFNCRYQIILKNKGNTAFFQDAKFNFDPTKMTYVSSSEPYFTQTTGQITFYNGIVQEPFEVRMYECIMRINAPTDASPVNSGDIISTSASSFGTGDETPDDNVSSLSQIAVNSFDPNDKTCLEGDFVNPSKIGQYLHYNINFENTGTADAVNIVVKDVIDATKFDVNSLQVIYSSNDVRTDVKGNTAEFIFQNINLARANGGPGGHGNVLFKIKTLPTLPINTEVKNKANIYFDYNFPIITNEAKTTFAVLSNSGFVLDNSISVYPNPATSKININCNNAIKSIEVYDVQGRILETIIDNKTIIYISEKSNGIYFLKINTDKGSKVEKIIKD